MPWLAPVQRHRAHINNGIRNSSNVLLYNQRLGDCIKLEMEQYLRLIDLRRYVLVSCWFLGRTDTNYFNRFPQHDSLR